MRLHLAGTYGYKEPIFKYKPPYLLESYISIRPWQLEYIKSPYCKGFILDSGAFTFMNSKKNAKLDWEEYVMKYADFINKYDIELFAELDIDSIVGLRKVEELRDLLEAETGKQPIVVWHKSRGKQDFLDTVASYPYVAIGGIVAKEIKKSEYKYFPWFIRKAHEYGAQIHGMGFSPLNGNYGFDSVDTTSWVGSKYSQLYKFDGKKLVPLPKKKNWRRKVSCFVFNEYNIREWTAYAKYLDKRGG
ncbi:MAG: hypothetical protein H0Z19_07350 [Archaeoglobus sp.]|uniref:hypothetical protein n=1 Tax=Archaeoglobus sp. TaxID=1872626 RepID=UPI001D5DA9A5|nr:hypothetical protein [Archaeoglobus sp.]MBO8180280.1 hypothetical protein [Archaeoglobus sp.]